MVWWICNMNEIYNPQECETHLQNFEDKGYKILQEKGIKYIQIPLGNKYSESQLEKFAETIKLEFGIKTY